MHGFFSKQSIIAKPRYNRWRAVPASICIHLCIGSVYAWSIYNPALIKAVGVAGSSADDWTLGQVVQIFVVAIVFVGLSAAVAGKWFEIAGPRTVCLAAAAFWGGGNVLAGIGIIAHQLWLIYLGYGVIGGIGLGLGYVSPVVTLIRWFPDRKGMAAGFAIMGFGGGTIIAIPMKEFFLRLFYQAPDYLGAVDSVQLVTEGGRRFAEIGGKLVEVVIVSASEVSEMIVPGDPGVYALGTGSVGAGQTFIAMGLIFMAMIAVSALSYRIPAPGWEPEGRGKSAASKRHMITHENVHVNDTIKTPQFYQLWIVLCLNVTAGIGIIGLATTMVSEIFGAALPGVVDAAFAATYVLMIGVFNMIGRVFWASISDLIGRKKIYWIYFVGGAAMFLVVMLSAWQVTAGHAMLWLACFYVATMILFTFYGGGFASIPAYASDLFGSYHIGAIHGRLLTAWSVAGVLGPLSTATLRQFELERAVREVANSIGPETFRETFGAGIEQLELLVENKTVTLAKLLEVAPAGTVDPTPGLYNTTMILMTALLLIGMAVNATVKPVDSKHYLSNRNID